MKLKATKMCSHLKQSGLFLAACTDFVFWSLIGWLFVKPVR